MMLRRTPKYKPRRRPEVAELQGLYAITPAGLPRETLLAQVEAALRGGCRYVQLRDKTLPPAERLARAHALRALTARYGARFIINDDLALASVVAADGVHLGRDDGDWALARAILGPQRLLGVSCYADLEAAQRASAIGVDYVAFGAAFPSPSKPQAAVLPPGFIARARAQLALPLCVIGGITLSTAASLRDQGADLLAVINDLFTAPEIAGQAACYQQLFTKAKP